MAQCNDAGADLDVRESFPLIKFWPRKKDLWMLLTFLMTIWSPCQMTAKKKLGTESTSNITTIQIMSMEKDIQHFAAQQNCPDLLSALTEAEVCLQNIVVNNCIKQTTIKSHFL